MTNHVIENSIGALSSGTIFRPEGQRAIDFVWHDPVKRG